MEKLLNRAALLAAVLLGATAATAQNLATTLPNGRRITPAGAWIKVAPYPYTVAIRPGGAQLVVPSIGWPFSLNIIDHSGAGSAGVSRVAVQRIPAGRKNDPEVQVHTGVVYSPDGKLVYDTSGDRPTPMH